MGSRSAGRKELEYKDQLADDAAKLGHFAVRVLEGLRRRGWTVATAESCTGGLLASLLTDQDGLGRWFDRGFVTYSEESKSEALGIDRIEIARHGAVSAEIAAAMAKGVLERSRADVAIAVTGFAGPAGPTDEIGLVYLACAGRDGLLIASECHFGLASREQIRSLSVSRALELLHRSIQGCSQ